MLTSVTIGFLVSWSLMVVFLLNFGPSTLSPVGMRLIDGRAGVMTGGAIGFIFVSFLFSEFLCVEHDLS